VHEDANIITGLKIDETLGDQLKVIAIVTGFGDRFDMERGRQETRKVSPLVPRREDRERPAFERVREREAAPRQSSFLGEDYDEQYDIPTFLRKSVD
jgi:cell division protein FtsZ